MEENAIAFFGLLERDVKFLREFRRSRKTPMKFKIDAMEHPVEFFGVKGDLSSEFEFVEVLEYKPRKGTHLLQINCHETDDHVLLYLPKKPGNFTTACRHIRDLRKERAEGPCRRNPGNETDERIHGGDDIRTPSLKFDSKCDLMPQLSGLRFYQGEPQPWLLNRAEQHTRFEPNSKGTRVSVRVSGGIDPFGGPIIGLPRPRVSG